MAGLLFTLSVACTTACGSFDCAIGQIVKCPESVIFCVAAKHPRTAVSCHSDVLSQDYSNWPLNTHDQKRESQSIDLG